MTDTNTLNAILTVIHACDNVQLATVRPDGYPETRHLANMMNRDTQNTVLYFMTGRHTPKAEQLAKNSKCALYYYDDKTHYALRLFGTTQLVDDVTARHAHWNDDFRKFGYSGPDDPEFILLRFTANEYKYYDASGMQSGKIK